MSFFHSILATDGISEVIQPQSVSVVNGTACGSIPFPASIRAKRNGVWDDFAATFDTTGYNSGTNGMYTLTGELDGFGTAVTINVWVLPSPTQWADLSDKSLLAFAITGDNLDRIVTSGTAKAGGTSIAQYSGTELHRPSYNGEGVYFNTNNGLSWGSTTSHATFHKDTNWSIYIVWYQITVPNTHFGEIISSNNSEALSTGITIAVDNRSASSKSNAILVWVTKSIAGQFPIITYSANDAVVPDSWNWLKAKFDGTTFTLVVNGGTPVTSTPSVAFSTGNSTSAMILGQPSGFVGGGGMYGYIKHVYMDATHVSGATETLLNSWADALCDEVIPLEDANVYMMGGQSNMGGIALNSNISAELDAGSLTGAYILTILPTPPTQTAASGLISSESYFARLDLGVNQNTEQTATKHGMEMRFGYEMGRYFKNCWMVKLGVSGTALTNTSDNDWKVASAQLYTKYNDMLFYTFNEMKHVFRKRPIFRAFIWCHGETDSLTVGAGAVYKTNFNAMFNGFLDTIIAEGLPCRIRLIIFRVTNLGSPAYDATSYANVRAAQADIGDNYIADNPSYSAYVKGSVWRTADDLTVLDTYHYNSASQDILGMYCFDQLKHYIRE